MNLSFRFYRVYLFFQQPFDLFLEVQVRDVRDHSHG